ncbi:acylphosphatase [Qipengyuania sp. YG27]|uniref:acylphosphatase n=1 Tax=Qipengyuania mesophila TaxID=2867246 RepID=A0ABS7JVZ9_9SPHN|nr:acylphosphatase [Qipengyuania mesophila]
MTARHCIVHGRVQGVFYRDWTVTRARELGLAGWVRNLPDGTVEALLEGDAETIVRMVAAMQQGPPRAAPTRIEQREVEPQGLDGFTRR